MPIRATTRTPAQTATRTSIRCSRRIFFTLASRSGTSRIVYDLSKEPPAAGTPLPNRPRVPPLPDEDTNRAPARPAGDPRPVSDDVRVRQGLRTPRRWLFDALHRNHGDGVVPASGIRELDQYFRYLSQVRLDECVPDLVVLD